MLSIKGRHEKQNSRHYYSTNQAYLQNNTEKSIYVYVSNLLVYIKSIRDPNLIFLVTAAPLVL